VDTDPSHPLTYTCPDCGQGPEEKCKNYRGKFCAPHRGRERMALHGGNPPVEYPHDSPTPLGLFDRDR